MRAAIIAAALGGAYSSGDWWRCRCPVHGSEGSTLALRDGDRALIVKCFAGCCRGDILAALRRLGLINQIADRSPSPPDPAALERRRAAEERDRQRRIAEALDFWRHKTSPASGTAVARYWRARGLALPIPATIRASRSWLRHPNGGTRPAMIGLVEHVNYGPVAIHRTWVQSDGLAKASFREPRLSLGPIGGGAVRLAPAGEILLTGEGIETSASAMLATGWPAWAALSAVGLEQLILPPLPLARVVIVLADNDTNRSGQAATRKAAERWLAEGRRVRIAMPPVPGTDFNDVLLGRAYAEVRHVAA
jgi:putative DNA primase/helicase